MQTDFFQQYGWICPKCGAVFGPLSIQCLYCNTKFQKSNMTTGTTIEDYLKKYDNIKIGGINDESNLQNQR